MKMKFTNEELELIKEKTGAGNCIENEPMKNHATMQVGGPADYFFTPETSEAAAFLIKALNEKKMKYYIIGNGSKLIFRDEGYRGAIILIRDNFSKIEIEGETVRAGAGATNKELMERTLEAGLSGFEFASGIPGCIGGAIAMNAGAYDGEMKDITVNVTVITPDGAIKVIPADEMQFGYRTSCVEKKGYLVLEAEFKLHSENKAQIRARYDDYTGRRASKQPLEYPSCGSVFKRPEGHFAGKLISDAGLKGYEIGGAQISYKHAGFIVNKNNASAKDVMDLIELAQNTVYEKFGVVLQCEAKIIE